MNKYPEILALIPARKGSKGIPGKNLKTLGGKPLIQYTIETAMQCEFLSTVLVSSDCEDIVRVSRQFKGIETPFIRPAGISLDNTPTLLVIKHAVRFLAKQQKKFDYVCLLQPTTPFRSKNLIHEAIVKTMETKADCLVTISKIPDAYNPNWAFQLNNEDQLFRVSEEEKLVSCRTGIKAGFLPERQVYVIKTELIQNRNLLGGNLIGMISEPGINLDTPADWEKAENLIRNGAIL